MKDLILYYFLRLFVKPKPNPLLDAVDKYLEESDKEIAEFLGQLSKSGRSR